MKKRKLITLFILIFVLLGALGIYILFRPQPIKVALVNYPTFMVARMATSADAKNAKVSVEENLDKLGKYDAVLLWGMGGTKWNEEDRLKIKALERKKIPYVVVAAVNPENRISNISNEQKDTIASYIMNGGSQNYQSLFNYIRSNILHKNLREGSVNTPIEIADNTFFGKTDNDIFDSYEGYQQYYQTHGYINGAPKVAMLIGFATPFISNREHIDATVLALEKAGLNVYPFSAGKDRVALLKEIKPDIIIYIPHGRLLSGNIKEGITTLKELNVPVVTALTLTVSKEKWLKDKQGMVGGLLSQSVASPEFDGATCPYALYSLEKDSKSGFLLFQAMDDRLKGFTSLVKNYIKLKKKPNKDKKVAIFYFKGPGQNSFVAQGIEVLPSLYNVLLDMKQNGYTVTGLPKSFEEFKKVMMERGPIFNSYAEGATAHFIESGYPEFVPADSLSHWIQTVLTPIQQKTLKDKYGDVPGDFFSIIKNNQKGIAVTRIQFGNVVLLPQPGQTIGTNDFAAVHGSNPIPPYPYIAAYLWVQKGFHADVLSHFGTHGSLEFINGKQIALSNEDWTDRLVNDLPHIYYYTIANVGESMMAKRRSYATTVSYLAQPFIETGLRGEVKDLLSLTDKYLSKEQDDEQLSLRIKKITIEKGYHRDLRLDTIPNKPYTRDEIEEISDYAEELAVSKIPGGLYTSGVKFSERKIKSSVKLISVDPIAYGLADIDIQLKKVSPQQIRNERFFTEHYRNRAAQFVESVLKGKKITPDEALVSLGVNKSILEKADTFLQNNASPKSPITMQMIGSKPKESKQETNKEDIKNHSIKTKSSQNQSDGKTAASKKVLKTNKGNVEQKDPSNHSGNNHKIDAHTGATKNSDKKAPHAREESTKEASINKTSQMAGVPKEQLSKPAASKEFSSDEQHLAATIEALRASIKNINNYYQYLEESPQMELSSWENALSGGYTAPTPGGDYIANPQALPTGRNLYAINAETTPTKAAWNKGIEMAEAMLTDYQKRHNGEYPKKVSFTLWSSSFIESEGANIAEILYLLGCEPVRDPMGRIQDVRLIPREELKHKRIDVVIQTSGQFRDLAASRLYLIQKAVDMAANAKNEKDNEVAKGAEAAEKVLLEKGLSPNEARSFSTQRIFGGVNGNYGTGIQEMVEAGDKWENESEIAKVYLNNMGAVYGDSEKWGAFTEGLFEAALQNTDVVIQPRQSNTWGPLSLDHVYEFMGGLTLTVRNVTGKDPEGYFNDLRNHHLTKVTEVKRSIGNEARTTILNPTYIKEMLAEGQGAANEISETIRNTYGWNVMKPNAIDDQLWNEIYDTYITDINHLGVQKFFDEKNPAAFQEITAVMLETIRKGMWDATPEQISNIAKIHAQSIEKYGPGCSGFVCDNGKLRDFIGKELPKEERVSYNENIKQIREKNIQGDQKAQRLKKEESAENSTINSSIKTQSSYTITYVIVGGVVIILIIAIIIRQRRKQNNQKN